MTAHKGCFKFVSTSRRAFLASSAAALATWLPGVNFGAQVKRARVPIGVQTWSIREQLKTAPRATLRRLADIGFSEIEWGNIAQNEPFVQYAREHGMQPVGLHFDQIFKTPGSFQSWVAAGSPERIPDFDPDALANAATRNGFKYVGYADWATVEARTTLDGARRFCAAIDQVGRQMAERKLRFLFHPEPPVFMKIGNTTLYDILVDSTDARYVGFEPDVFWLTHVGRDPVAEIHRLGTRTGVVHLKDRLKGAPIAVPTDEVHIDPSLFVSVGSGSIDFPAVISAARSVGVKHFMIEQDETPGDPVLSLGKSFTYVQSIMESA